MLLIKIHENRCELEVNSISPSNRASVTCIIHWSREENQPTTLFVRSEMRRMRLRLFTTFFLPIVIPRDTNYICLRAVTLRCLLLKVLSGENIFFCLFTTVHCGTTNVRNFRRTRSSISAFLGPENFAVITKRQMEGEIKFRDPISCSIHIPWWVYRVINVCQYSGSSRTFYVIQKRIIIKYTLNTKNFILAKQIKEWLIIIAVWQFFFHLQNSFSEMYNRNKDTRKVCWSI